MKNFAEMWATIGWKVAYAAIVVTAFVMLVVMFSQEVYYGEHYHYYCYRSCYLRRRMVAYNQEITGSCL